MGRAGQVPRAEEARELMGAGIVSCPTLLVNCWVLWNPMGMVLPQVVQGIVLSSEWSEVRSRMILEGFGLLSGVPLAQVFSGEVLENLEKPF